MNWLLKILLVAFWIWGYLSHPAIAANTPDAAQMSAAQVFDLNCAGCHLHGGNVIRRSKTLKLKDLQRNGYDDLAAITAIVSNGKGNMSAYRERLNPTEIEAIAAYVLEQAHQGWPQVKG